jgi:probable selenium-dependent hydroxylase accessory protein YqeC
MFSPSPSAWHEKLREALETYGHVFVARNITGSAKVEGISPASVDTIYREPKVDYLILEADGSAGHPVKAPGEHEPVIPSLATIVVAMMGLEALGKRLEPEFVFRPDQFEMVTGLDRGERLTANRLARIFQVPEGLFKGAPICARRAAFLNKLDLLPNDQEAKELADLLTQGPHASVDVAVVGSIANGLFFPICRSQ